MVLSLTKYIDTDFESSKREDVKKYIQDRFGKHNVCSIGTYSTLQSKAAMRDMLRFYGEQPQNINYFGGMIEDSNEDYASIFHAAIGNNKLKEFINDHLDAIQDIPLILGQSKSASVHAAGVVIVPNVDRHGNKMEIYDWFPCKMMDGVLVSEWEGPQLEESGFLKADILGLSQLDKLHNMIDLISINHNEDIVLSDISTKDQAVFNDLFKLGYTQDVFQFTTDGLAAFCREVKPTSVDELATMNALYRPGAMNTGAHTDYVKIKWGQKEPEYDWGLEAVTKETFGLLIFQETSTKIVQTLGGFTEDYSELIRAAIGKKKIDKIKEYKPLFIEGAMKQGCPEYEAEKIWAKIEGTATYQFNKSHSVAYSLIGYQTAWIKKYYPLEFWTVSLQHANDDEIPKRVAEMRKFEGLNLFAPDINKSKSTFYTDWETNSIYWSIGRIKHVGEVALEAIQKNREQQGEFFSLEEFVQRCKGQAVNSRVVKHLIYSGCFDKLHNIEHPFQRNKLMNEFSKLYNSGVVEDEILGVKEFYWYKQQRNLSGFGFFDYGTIVEDLGFSYNDYVVPDQIQMESNIDCHIVVSGLLVDFIKRKTKKGEMCKLTLDHNNDLIDVVLWNDVWETVRAKIEAAEGQGVMLSGQIQYDGYNKKNVVYSNDQTIVTIF